MNNPAPHSARYWAVVPAAGVGSRMQAAIPKQYLSLRGKCVIEHTLERLCNHPRIEGVVVAIGQDDDQLQALDIARHTALSVTHGGAERCHSVLNGLTVLAQQADDNDWVLVHDAARPCIHRDDIDKMIAQLSDHGVGGLLGVPVADTMKRTNAHGDILETVSRDNLWRAGTPQMFRLGVLRRALQQALADDFLVTDEASAIEHTGQRPVMIEGRADNIKITRPEDLQLAELFLAQQENA